MTLARILGRTRDDQGVRRLSPICSARSRPSSGRPEPVRRLARRRCRGARCRPARRRHRLPPRRPGHARGHGLARWTNAAGHRPARWPTSSGPVRRPRPTSSGGSTTRPSSPKGLRATARPSDSGWSRFGSTRTSTPTTSAQHWAVDRPRGWASCPRCRAFRRCSRSSSGVRRPSGSTGLDRFLVRAATSGKIIAGDPMGIHPGRDRSGRPRHDGARPRGQHLPLSRAF